MEDVGSNKANMESESSSPVQHYQRRGRRGMAMKTLIIICLVLCAVAFWMIARDKRGGKSGDATLAIPQMQVGRGQEPEAQSISMPLSPAETQAMEGANGGSRQVRQLPALQPVNVPPLKPSAQPRTPSATGTTRAQPRAVRGNVVQRALHWLHAKIRQLIRSLFTLRGFIIITVVCILSFLFIYGNLSFYHYYVQKQSMPLSMESSLATVLANAQARVVLFVKQASPEWLYSRLRSWYTGFSSILAMVFDNAPVNNSIAFIKSTRDLGYEWLLERVPRLSIPGMFIRESYARAMKALDLGKVDLDLGAEVLTSAGMTAASNMSPMPGPFDASV